MQLLSGYPFWLIKDGLPYTYPALESSIQTEVAIIGGGISGALVGYYLTEAGIPCVVADRHTIGLGSTCGSTSLLQYEIDVPLCDLIKDIGEQNAVAAYRLCAAAIDTLHTIAQKTGMGGLTYKQSLYYAAKKEHFELLKNEYQARKAAGFGVHLLGTGEMLSTYGIDVPGALLSEKAAQTDAYALTHSLHQYSIKKGARVFDRTLIERVEEHPGFFVLHAANGCSITARNVVYATGYETAECIDKKIVSFKTTYATISEQLHEGAALWKDEPLIWSTGSPYLYMRTTPDKRIIVGGRDEKFNGSIKEKQIRRISTALSEDFNDLFPHIPFQREFYWAGVFGHTKDGLPYIGTYKNVPHRYFALGFGGNGITFSVIAAELITAMISGSAYEFPDLFSFSR